MAWLQASGKIRDLQHSPSDLECPLASFALIPPAETEGSPRLNPVIPYGSRLGADIVVNVYRYMSWPSSSSARSWRRAFLNARALKLLLARQMLFLVLSHSLSLFFTSLSLCLHHSHRPSLCSPSASITPILQACAHQSASTLLVV